MWRDFDDLLSFKAQEEDKLFGFSEDALHFQNEPSQQVTLTVNAMFMNKFKAYLFAKAGRQKDDRARVCTSQVIQAACAGHGRIQTAHGAHGIRTARFRARCNSSYCRCLPQAMDTFEDKGLSSLQVDLLEKSPKVRVSKVDAGASARVRVAKP